MEIGAVKQAFNNEVILLKKPLTQAKTQIIHKLTRKSVTLTEKKCPDAIKDKLKRKAESAVREVLIMKKIKPKDLAKFIVTHKGQLNDYINKPDVDLDKACARLLLHKALKSKYQLIRDRFANVSIDDLCMSRTERRQLKKEALEKQQNKKKRTNSETDNTGGVWEVKINNDTKQELDTKDENAEFSDSSDLEAEHRTDITDDSVTDEEPNQEYESKSTSASNLNTNVKLIPSKKTTCNSEEKDNNENKMKNGKKTNQIKEKKPKNNKNNNLNEKVRKRKFNKQIEDVEEQSTQIVDPFFITSTGDNYMSLVEPRPPDEITEVHQQGNRKYRRAVMFGHAPKHRKNFKSNNNSNRLNQFDKNKPSNNFNSKDNSKQINDNNSEKLHPSWEAKKRQSTIVPFKGKKILFDDS